MSARALSLARERKRIKPPPAALTQHQYNNNRLYNVKGKLDHYSANTGSQSVKQPV